MHLTTLASAILLTRRYDLTASASILLVRVLNADQDALDLGRLLSILIIFVVEARRN